MKGGVYRILTFEISNEKSANMWHILNIHPFSFVPELHTLYFLIKNRHPFANTDIKKTPNCRFHLQALFVSGSKQKKQSPVKDFFCRKAGLFSRLRLCFLGKKEAFTPKEVSIRVKRSKHFRKMLTSFLNISICFGRLHIL